MIKSATCRRSRRRGLAPLELVLCLPILLFIMALMVNFGAVVSWKVRSLVVARNTAWADRREGAAGFPRPWYWPAPAAMGSQLLSETSTPELAVLDDPRVYHPVVRGPMPMPVHEDLFDPAQALRRGSSDFRRGYPMLRALGAFNVRSRHEVLERRWPWQDMEWPEVPMPFDQPPWRHLDGNVDRRIPVLYALPTAQDPGLRMAYIQAVIAVYYAPFLWDLFPLDHNTEFIRYSRRFGWGVWDYEAPDYHPIVQAFCRLDHDVARQRVDNLIERINNVPKQMTDDLISEQLVRDQNNPLGPWHPRGLYPWVIWELDRRINAQPPPPAQQAAAMRAEIAQLRQIIDTLTQFYNSLP